MAADTGKCVWPDGRCHLGREGLMTEWTIGPGEESSGNGREKDQYGPHSACHASVETGMHYVHQLHWLVGGKPNLLKEEQVDCKDQASWLVGSSLTCQLGLFTSDGTICGNITLAYICKFHHHMLIFAFPLWLWLSQLELHHSNHCCDDKQPKSKC